MANKIYIATSLDGYIARGDGSIDWLTDLPNPEGSDYGFGEFMAGIDAVVMGRKTFEVVLGFGQWPYMVPVVVLSRSLRSIPPGYEEKARIMSGSPAGITEQLNGEGFRNLYIDGGDTIRGFLRDDLIEEIIITRIPVILGSGIPLFGDMETEIGFRHIRTEILGGQLVKSSYKRKDR